MREWMGYGLLTGSPLSTVGTDVSSQLAGMSLLGQIVAVVADLPGVASRLVALTVVFVVQTVSGEAPATSAVVL